MWQFNKQLAMGHRRSLLTSYIS